MAALPTLARHAGLAALFVLAALLGTTTGVLFAYSDDLPGISALDDYTPDTITRVLGRDGTVVGEFAVERRVVLRYEDIPLQMRQAVLAAEDSAWRGRRSGTSSRCARPAAPARSRSS
jgi:penicillin-binding protein 1A